MLTRLFNAAQRYYADLGILGRILDLSSLKAEAEAEGRRLTERHDVPQGDDVPADLRDQQPRYLTTRDGYSIASLLHPNDKTIGSDSAAIGLAQGSLFALAMIAGTIVALLGILVAVLSVAELKILVTVVMLAVMGVATLAALLPTLALYQAEKGGLGAFGILFAIPLLAFAGVGIGSATGVAGIWGPGVLVAVQAWEWFQSMNLGAPGGPNFAIYGVATTLVIVGSCVSAVMGVSQVAPKTYKRIRTGFLENLMGPLGAILVLGLVFLMPLWVMVPIPVAMSAALLMWGLAAKNRKARAQDLMMNAIKYSGFDQNLVAALNRHSSAREQQCQKALKDKSPFVNMGTSMGVLTNQMDGYAPDAGLPFGLTLDDLSTHMLILGPTGSGKTSGTLRPLIKAIFDARKKVDLNGWALDEARNPYSIATPLRAAIAAGKEAWLVTDSPNRARALASKIDGAVKGWSVSEAQQRLDAVAPGTVIVVLAKPEVVQAIRSGVKASDTLVLEEVKSPLFGMLIMDGKGALADEARGASDLVIEPGVPLGLIEGLRIEDLVEAIAGVSGASTAKSGEGSGSAEFFNSAAREALRHAASLYFAMCEQEERFIANGWVPLGPNGEKPARNWIKTWAGLTRITQGILQIQRDRSGQPHKAPVIEMIIDFLTASEFPERRHPQFGRSGLLDQAIAYTNGVLTQDDRTLGNISATLEQWMSPIMSHSDLLPWASMETGVDPSIVLRGGIVGVNVPVFRYGIAGKIVQNLVRLRVATAIRRRADYPWEAMGETPVFLLMDEAQEVINEADGNMIAVGRSLGGRYVCATQNADSIQAKFGHDRADAVMDQFRSVIGIGMMSPDSSAFIQKRMGSGIIRVWNTQMTALPFQHLAANYAALPFHDKHHPLRAEMRTYLRQGAGVWRNDLEQGQAGQGSEDAPASAMSLDDHETHGTAFRASAAGVASVAIKQEAIYNPSIIDSYLSRPNVAIAQVQRGGVIRRDVIELKPVYTF
jgi:hypothetical protein